MNGMNEWLEDHIAPLRAEIDRLRKERDAAVRAAMATNVERTAEIGEARAELDRLRALNANLEAIVRLLAKGS